MENLIFLSLLQLNGSNCITQNNNDKYLKIFFTQKKFMKQIKKFALIILIPLSLLCSCNGNSNANASKDSNSSSTSSAKNSSANSTGDASFSCKIDGKEFSSSEKTEMLNVAVNLIGRNKGKVFYSFVSLKENASGTVDMLSFIVPGQQGSFTLTASNGAPGSDDYMLQGIFYVPNPVTVNIISISATKIAGIFSGNCQYTFRSWLQ